MSSNNSINSSTFTEIELSVIAIGLYLIISPIHGVSKVTKPLLKMLNVKTPTSLLLFTGLLFGVIYYFLIKFVLGPLYKKMRMQRFKVGGQAEFCADKCHVPGGDGGANDRRHLLDQNNPPGCSQMDDQESCENAWACTYGNEDDGSSCHLPYGNVCEWTGGQCGMKQGSPPAACDITAENICEGYVLPGVNAAAIRDEPDTETNTCYSIEVSGPRCSFTVENEMVNGIFGTYYRDISGETNDKQFINSTNSNYILRRYQHGRESGFRWAFFKRDPADLVDIGMQEAQEVESELNSLVYDCPSRACTPNRDGAIELIESNHERFRLCSYIETDRRYVCGGSAGTSNMGCPQGSQSRLLSDDFYSPCLIETDLCHILNNGTDPPSEANWTIKCNGEWTTIPINIVVNHEYRSIGGECVTACDESANSNTELHICEVPPEDPCADVRCGVHGTCTNGTCACENGWSGDQCQTAPEDPCTNVRCGVHGTCTNGTCACRDGWSGNRCQTAPPTCTCTYGRPATGRDCNPARPNWCDSCDPGYHISYVSGRPPQKVCEPNR